MKTLILQRLDTSNYLRSITIWLDGKKVGRIGFAERVKLEIPYETLELMVSLGWCKSEAVMLDKSCREEIFFIECSASLSNIFIRPHQYLRLHRVKKKDLPTQQQLIDFKHNFRKVAGISTFMLILFGVFFIYTLYVAIFENSPVWYALTILAGYNMYRISKGIRKRLKGQV